MLDRHQPETNGLRIRIEGSVQGVGMRPWVHELASSQGIAGRIWNDSDSVTIEAFGDAPSLEGFVGELRRPPMPAARVRELRCETIPFERFDRFEIVASRGDGARRPSIPPDLGLCEDCRREIFDSGDRRFRYAFTNCTRCGPRYTIALDVPYDRERTSMADFPMCADCRAEYEDVGDRRFHAQPVACPHCGPRLELVDGQGRALAGDPVIEAARLLRSGAIVAVKGLGGYHLACDACSEDAVARLRSRKHRHAKPLAVMVATMEDAQRVAHVDEKERELLRSPARPIVLVRRRRDARLAEGVSPGNPLVGVMLPYTPLHELLLDAVGRPLVMTSGNVSDEPMAFDDDDALARLGGSIAELLLRHDRRIVTRCDDSIERVVDGAPLLLRRGRGMTPDFLVVPREFPLPLLACGAQLKNAFCFGAGRDAWLGPHIGDLETDEACRGFEEAVERFARFVGISPEAIAHDRHPAYFSTRWALAQSARLRVEVQHHHAHVASAMAEHGIEGPVLGLAWDGTGDGGDGTAWGAELLLADAAGFRRLATLRPLPLAGGDTAIREVWRLALALLDDAFDGAPPLDALSLFDTVAPERITLVRSMLRSGLNAPLAHGAGRAFDAFGALVLGRPLARYEGEVAAALEFAAARGGEEAAYPFHVAPLAEASPVRAYDLRPALRAVVGDLLADVPAAKTAARFHATMAAIADAMVAAAIDEHGRLPLALTGGCFQNARLAAELRPRLERRTTLLRHAKVPPNDGGIALGQALVAAAALRGDACAAGADSMRPEVH